MSTPSSVVTGGATFSAAALAPLFQWALAGFHSPVPDGVPLLLAAGAITFGHAVHNFAAAWLAKKGIAVPSDPLLDAMPAAPKMTP